MERLIRLIHLLLFFVHVNYIYAQNEIEEIIEKKVERILESSDEIQEDTELFNQLLELANNPININCKDFEILLSLKLVNKFQYFQLLNYINQVQSIQSIHEIKFIEGFSETNVNGLKHFIRIEACKKQSFKLKKARQELTSGYSRIIQKQAGYKNINNATFYDSPNKVYLGTPEKTYSRYKLKSGDHLKIGFIAEKDAGEVLFKNNYKYQCQDLLKRKLPAFDYFSAFASIENLGFIKKIIVGDFHLQFGQGLTLWSSLAFGKSTITTDLKKYGRGVLPNSSSNENHFFRGIATSFSFKNFELSLFYSNKKRDGNLVSKSKFSSLQNTGTHRTINEIMDKNSISEKLAGANLSFSINQIRIAFTSYHQSFDKSLTIDDQIYKKYNFTGDENFCYGMDFQSIFNKLELFGEFSISKNHSRAIISGLNYYLNSQAKIHIHYRNYSASFQNFYSNGLSENSNSINEKGFYVGIDLDLHPKWTLTTYTDYFRFPWLKSGVDSPSQGNEQLFELRYLHSSTLSIYGRYKRQKKERNQKNKDFWYDYLVSETKESLRLHLSFQLSANFQIQSRAEWQFYTLDNKKSNGLLMFHELNYNSTNNRLKGSFRYVTFNTQDYNNRIYTYEKDVRYAFSIPSYYGKGNRFYITLAYRISDRLISRFKFSQTNYIDRKTIGTGLDMIDGSKKSEIKFQLQLKF